MLPAGWLWGVCGPHCVLPWWQLWTVVALFIWVFGFGVLVVLGWGGGVAWCLSVGAGGYHGNKVT